CLWVRAVVFSPWYRAVGSELRPLLVHQSEVFDVGFFFNATATTEIYTLSLHDALPISDDRLEAFYDNPNALRDYFRDIGRMVLAAEGRKANDSHADCYQYFCVPEYGTANGRLHFHAVHFMRTLPTGSVDPNFGR